MNFVLVGRSIRIAEQVLQSIRAFSGGPCMVLGNKESQPLGRSRLCQEHLSIDLYGADDEFVRIVNRIKTNAPQSVLIAFDCDGSRLVNRVRDSLRMTIAPIPTSPTLEMFDDKWRFQAFCNQHSLPTPQTIFVGAKFQLDFNAVSAALGMPFVLKPITGSGSLGVQVVGSRAQFENDMLHNTSYEHGPLIAQKYIDGADIGFNLLSFGGRMTAFAVQQRQGPHIAFLVSSRLEELADKMCRISKYHGPMNVDARIDKATGEVFLLESNPRFWGNTAASAWCGLNFVAKSLEGCPPWAAVLQRLSSGLCNMRYPLFVPSQWWRLGFDTGPRGRIIRAQVFNLHNLGLMLCELPQTAARFLRYLQPWLTRLGSRKRPGFGAAGLAASLKLPL